MKDFAVVMHTLSTLDREYPGLTFTPKDGVLEIKMYVGMETTDLLKQAREMFSDRD